MRIFIHDFAGHAFPIHLSRWLAARGHTTWHAYSVDIDAPRGALATRANDPVTLQILPISLGRPINKYNLVRRVFEERRYGRLLVAALSREAPDVVLSGNTSPIVQAMIRRWARRNGAAFVYWLQDVFSLALEHAMNGPFKFATTPMRAMLRRLEFGTLAGSDAAVLISKDFQTLLEAEGVSAQRMYVIENWAPVDEMMIRPKDNDWARTTRLWGKFVFLYSGTLGLKHNPALLSALAESFRDDGDVRVVVISNGLGREWLEKKKALDDLTNLQLFDYVPFEMLPDCLGCADVLIAILEPHAGVLSVPSKVLTYIAAEKPILSAIPPENLAANIVTGKKLGLNVVPTDIEGFIAAAKQLRKQPATEYTAASRAYKQAHFNIDVIGERFLAVFGQAIKAARQS